MAEKRRAAEEPLREAFQAVFSARSPFTPLLSIFSLKDEPEGGWEAFGR